MPKVATVSYRLNEMPATVEVKFSEHGRRGALPSGFSIQLPDEVAFAIETKFVTGDTLALCTTAFEKIIADFKTAKTKIEKVIVFKFEASARPKSGEQLALEKAKAKAEAKEKAKLYDRDPSYFKEDVDEEFDELNSSYDRGSEVKTRGLTVRWQLAERRTYKDKEDFHEIGGKNTVMIYESKWLPWTVEREQFFRDLDRVLDALVLRASTVLDLPAEKFALLVDSRGTLALGFDGGKK